MEIEFQCPINGLSYGICGSYFTQELSKLGHKVNLFPVGQAEETNEYIKPALINSQSSKYSEVSLRLFHQHLLYQRIGKGKHFGFPIFELDKFNGQEKNSILSCDELIVCSNWAKQVCLDNNIDIPISVVPLGVDRDIFYESELPPTDEVWYISCAKRELRKGFDFLSETFNLAFEDINKYNVRLFILADGHPSHYTEKEIEYWDDLLLSGKLKNKITLIPRQKSQSDIANIIRKCHCGIFPSRAEGWCLPLLEVLSCGRYAIATNCTGQTEFINDKNCFLLNDLKSVKAMDNKWFHGQGNWWEPSKEEIIECFRKSYNLIKEKNEVNNEGIKTAKIFSWNNSAKMLFKSVS